MIIGISSVYFQENTICAGGKDPSLLRPVLLNTSF